MEKQKEIKMTTWIFSLKVEGLNEVVILKVYSEKKAMVMRKMIEELTGEKMIAERYDEHGRIFEN